MGCEALVGAMVVHGVGHGAGGGGLLHWAMVQVVAAAATAATAAMTVAAGSGAGAAADAGARVYFMEEDWHVWCRRVQGAKLDHAGHRGTGSGGRPGAAEAGGGDVGFSIFIDVHLFLWLGGWRRWPGQALGSAFYLYSLLLCFGFPLVLCVYFFLGHLFCLFFLHLSFCSPRLSFFFSPSPSCSFFCLQVFFCTLLFIF